MLLDELRIEPTAGEDALERLRRAHRSSGTRFPPEDSPFGTLFVDLTHRCNMACRNCYIPVRELPDLPVEWLYGVLSRLPRRARIRLAGAEPTVRRDLPEIITRVRALGHIPVLLTNGLKLGRRTYVAELKRAGLRTIHYSANGGLRDELYEAIDGMPCADRKREGLENAIAERMNVTVGMILVPGVNDFHLPEFLGWMLARGVRDIHFRSVGATGRHMEGKPFTLDDLEDRLREALPPRSPALRMTAEGGSSRDYRLGKVGIQLTQWPDLGSRERGRVTPEAMVEPMFESILSNEFHY